MTAGLVLVRQKPGSAKGVMFITIEDETGPANIVVWPALFEKQRRIVLGSAMMAINGKIQREGDVVHLVAQQLFDLSGDLAAWRSRYRFQASDGQWRRVRTWITGQSGFSRPAAAGVQARDIFCSRSAY
jgi:error-prone DNA polymerase